MKREYRKSFGRPVIGLDDDGNNIIEKPIIDYTSERREYTSAGFNFYSVYEYSEEALKHIESTGDTTGVNKFPVISKVLFVDVDDNQYKDKVRQAFLDIGAEIFEFTTGNKGFHLHIPIETMTGIDVPYSQRKYVESLGLNSDEVDFSIYRSHMIIRMVDAVHNKTGLRKELIKHYPGKKLQIPLLKKPAKEYEDTTESDSEDAMKRFKENLLENRGPGSRHGHMFILYADGINAGLSGEDLLDWLLWWNARQSEPKDETEVVKSWKGFMNGETRISFHQRVSDTTA